MDELPGRLALERNQEDGKGERAMGAASPLASSIPYSIKPLLIGQVRLQTLQQGLRKMRLNAMRPFGVLPFCFERG